jgi:hypothetical protein
MLATMQSPKGESFSDCTVANKNNWTRKTQADESLKNQMGLKIEAFE